MGRKKRIVISCAVCVLIALGIIFFPGVVGVSASRIEEDARKSQRIGTWEVSKSMNAALCAMVFYDDTLDHHTFSIYVNRNGFSFGYFFRSGGSSYIIADGIQAFTCDDYGSAILSLNRDSVERIELDNGMDVTRIHVDPAKPFAAVIPINCGAVTLYDVNDTVVPITATYRW